MAIIYHLTTQQEWLQAKQKGRYETPSLAREGFIHCSEERQIAGVLDRYFQGQTGRLKLSIETERLSSPLYYDWSPSLEDTFPNIYGPIKLDAVVGEEIIEK